MEPVRRASAGNVCLPLEGSEPPVSTAAYTVQRGDTLSKLAARLQAQGLEGTREDIIRLVLTLNPQVEHRDRILAGAVLQLPAVGASTVATVRAPPGGDRVEPYSAGGPVLPYRPVGAEGVTGERGLTAGVLALAEGAALSVPASPVQFQLQDGTRFGVSADGTPLYKQNAGVGEGGWGGVVLHDGARKAATLGRAGCAVTAVAMALSKLSGQTVTPEVLDRHLDANGGYASGSNALRWAVAGGVMGLSLDVERHAAWEPERVDAELAVGRPVVIGVGYKSGSLGGANGTDHWLCLTRRDPVLPDVYYANDPATGEEVKLLRQPGGALLEVLVREGAEPRRAPYRTTGPWTSFSAPGVA